MRSPLPTTTIHAFFETAARLGPRPCWKYGARTISWTEAAQLVRKAARAFIALGVKAGEAVSIVGANRPEWVIADLGALAAGGVPAPIYPTLTAEQAWYIAGHSGASVAVVQDGAQLQKLRSQKSGLQKFVLIEGKAEGALSWEEFLALEGAVPDRLAELKPDGLATLIYTSGTTGPPKAVMLSHDNLVFAAQTAQRIAETGADDVLVSYLPLSHIAEQMITLHAPAVAGSQIWFCDQLDRLGDALREARPTIFFGVPRVWEKMQAKMLEAVAAAPERRQKMFHAARRSTGLWRRLAERVVLRKARKALGLDRARFLVTGAAAMPRATLDFFDSLGLPVLDVWGMSESAAMGTANLPDARKKYTIGRPPPGAELRIGEDGEILLRGRHVFMGYFKDEAATREALDQDGWLHTGDVGEQDADGFVRITDRKKELLITSGGKNVSPANIEGQLGQIAGVSQAIVVGDARKHLAALIVPDPVSAARLPGVTHGTLAALALDPAFLQHVERGIAQVNGTLANYETIKKFKVLPVQFSIESGELTPTLKLKRKVVAQKFASEIDALFA